MVQSVSFEVLPKTGWCKELPKISEDLACKYLRKLGGYTKNFRTGVRLCQCGHVYDIETTSVLQRCEEEGTITKSFVKAKCRPTMRKHPPFYQNFICLVLETPGGNCISIESANCMCPAGKSGSCVHVAALLLTLAEVTQTACTSLPCAWSRPSTHGQPQQTAQLDFGKASVEGYKPYTGGHVLDVTALLLSCEQVGIVTGAGRFFSQEQQRQREFQSSLLTTDDLAAKAVLSDPIDKLSHKDISEITVDDLIKALEVTPQEVALIQEMTTGQKENPLWMDARQWRVTASNFGRVCNRRRDPGFFPSSLVKLCLGDYGSILSPPLQWGCTHEGVAIKAYEQKTGLQVHHCGIFLSWENSFLGASPDGVLVGDDKEFGILEVKCPYKHRLNAIPDACKDNNFHLELVDGQAQLRKTHDYYFQVTGQLAITEAAFCDFVTWTCNDLHVVRVYLDSQLWGEMLKKVKDFYYTSLAPEIIRRLSQM